MTTVEITEQGIFAAVQFGIISKAEAREAIGFPPEVVDVDVAQVATPPLTEGLSLV